jgi:MFS family permease
MTFSTSSTPTSTTNWDARLWGALVVLCGVLFLDGLDVSMVGMALPSIRTDLGLTTSQLQWVVSGYVLGYGGFLLLGGRTADLLGRRTTLLVALGVFTVASAIGGVVNDGNLLIVARFLKGVSAAFTAPAGLSIITTTFPEGPVRNKALSIYTTVGASGFSLGLVLGGLLTELGWRWTFLLPAPVAAALILLGRKFIPVDRGVSGGRSAYDVPGALTVSAAMLLLVRTVVTAPSSGWGAPSIVAGFVGSAALLVAFVAIERRSAHPLLRLGILRSPRLVRANLGALAMFGSYVGFQFIGTLYMQTLLGWSSLTTALAFLPAGLIVVAGSTRIAPVINRVGTPRLIVVAFVSFVAGYALFLRIGTAPSYAAVLLPSMILLGVGFALGFPSLNIQATDGVADHEQGLASGLLNTSFQLGGAIGLAVVSAVVTSGTGTGTSQHALLAGFRPGLGVVTGIGALGLVAALSGVLSARRREQVEEDLSGLEVALALDAEELRQPAA